MFRFGRFFTPAGIWSVDHYPPFVPTQERPGHIRKIFPQLVDGVMVYGTAQMGKHYLNYNVYYVNGEGNDGHGDANDDKGIGAKASAILGIPMFSHFEVGGTVYTDPKDTTYGDNERLSIGVHGKAKIKDITLQSEAAYATFEDGATSKGTVSGYYAQIIYEPSAWGVGFRHDMYDSDRSVDDETTTNSLFVNYRFNVNLVVKAEHHFIDDDKGNDDSKTIFSVVSYLE